MLRVTPMEAGQRARGAQPRDEPSAVEIERCLFVLHSSPPELSRRCVDVVLPETLQSFGIRRRALLQPLLQLLDPLRMGVVAVSEDGVVATAGHRRSEPDGVGVEQPDVGPAGSIASSNGLPPSAGPWAYPRAQASSSRAVAVRVAALVVSWLFS